MSHTSESWPWLTINIYSSLSIIQLPLSSKCFYKLFFSLKTNYYTCTTPVHCAKLSRPYSIHTTRSFCITLLGIISNKLLKTVTFVFFLHIRSCQYRYEARWLTSVNVVEWNFSEDELMNLGTFGLLEKQVSNFQVGRESPCSKIKIFRHAYDS